MNNGTIVSFYTSGSVYGEEISKFECAMRPIVGEIWYIPMGRYPFEDNGEIKNDSIDFATVKILEVRVIPYPLGRPSSPSIMAVCEIMEKSNPYKWSL